MKFTSHCFVGGVQGSVAEDAQVLRAGCQIAIGTPGRMIQMINERKMDCHQAIMLIIDEADEMLSRGFA